MIDHECSPSYVNPTPFPILVSKFLEFLEFRGEACVIDRECSPSYVTPTLFPNLVKEFLEFSEFKKVSVTHPIFVSIPFVYPLVCCGVVVVGGDWKFINFKIRNL